MPSKWWGNERQHPWQHRVTDVRAPDPDACEICGGVALYRYFHMGRCAKHKESVPQRDIDYRARQDALTAMRLADRKMRDGKATERNALHRCKKRGLR